MSTEQVQTELPHTAITSWSGFIYQGKVALYHTLRLLENQGECSEYKLQLDSFEDFAILNAQSEPLSFHQVKARKTQYYKEYQADISKVNTKATARNCDKAFFHTAREIANIPATADIALDEAPVKLYEYDGQPYCGVDEIDKKIEEQLKKLWLGQGYKEEDD